MTNGIFRDDAERDNVIIRIEERQREIQEDLREIKDRLARLCDAYTGEIKRLEADLAQTRVWVGIFSAVFIPLVVYLLQTVLK